MNIFEHTVGFSRPRLGKQILVLVVTLGLLSATWPVTLSAYQDQQAPDQQAPAQATQQAPAQATQQAPAQGPQAPPYAQQTPAQLQQLVAPIALYPDSLVAQVLAASTFPEQVVEADRWVQAHPDLKGKALGQAVDQQPWDPSVKALTAFPTVLGNMDKNLSWTSSLGDANYNQQPDVMAAVQEMRRRAEQSGNLKTTPQQTVTTQDSSVVIQPASPDVVYVPAYDPWLVYGSPLYPWPGWYPYPGIWFGGPYLSFGLGFGIGFFGGFGWGWGNWGLNWRGGYPLYGGARYYSRSNTFYNRGNFYRGAGARGGAFARGNVGGRGFDGNAGARAGVADRSGASARAFNGNAQAARGYAAPRGQTGVRSGAFSGYSQGGQARGFSSRGSTSFGGGGMRGGGGGGRGGGRR